MAPKTIESVRRSAAAAPYVASAASGALIASSIAPYVFPGRARTRSSVANVTVVIRYTAPSPSSCSIASWRWSNNRGASSARAVRATNHSETNTASRAIAGVAARLDPGCVAMICRGFRRWSDWMVIGSPRASQFRHPDGRTPTDRAWARASDDAAWPRLSAAASDPLSLRFAACRRRIRARSRSAPTGA